MRRLGLVLMAAGVLLGGPQAAAQENAAYVDVIELEGVIDPTTADYLADEIDRSVETGSGLVVIQIDTPGGLDVSMRDMVATILASEVPVAVWVGPPGARAASAGVFLVYASHVAAMAPATNIGAAHPVNLGGGETPDAAEEKAVNDAAKFLRSLAERRGRPTDFAEAAVRESESLSAQEAVDREVIEVLSPSLTDLLAQLDGREVQTDRGTETLVTVATEDRPLEIRFHQMGLLRQILHAVSNPTVAFLLLTLGFWAIIFEISQPGFGIAGVGGAIALVLAFYALAVLPVNLAGLILVLLGLVLFTIDVFVQGLGVFTVGGALAFGIGGFLLFAGASPEFRISPWVIVGLLIGSVLFFGFAMTAALRARRRASMTGQEGLVGLTGEAKADLDPEGHVWVKGALWKARALGEPIPEGSRIRVRRVDGLLLLVQREEQKETAGAREGEA
ncbi:MAG TPA: nodulation protein NfeD [Actinomycetota bacterium]